MQINMYITSNYRYYYPKTKYLYRYIMKINFSRFHNKIDVKKYLHFQYDTLVTFYC